MSVLARLKIRESIVGCIISCCVDCLLLLSGLLSTIFANSTFVFCRVMRLVPFSLCPTIRAVIPFGSIDGTSFVLFRFGCSSWLSCCRHWRWLVFKFTMFGHESMKLSLQDVKFGLQTKEFRRLIFSGLLSKLQQAFVLRICFS